MYGKLITRCIAGAVMAVLFGAAPSYADNAFESHEKNMIATINALESTLTGILEDLPPSWSKKLPADDGDAEGCNSTRFKCVLDNEAVLDRETGLVWVRSPPVNTQNWFSAMTICQGVSSTAGGRFGWRLPESDELATLQIPIGSGLAILPDGHPFIDVDLFVIAYWTATPSVVFGATDTRKHVRSFTPPASASIVNFPTSTAYRAWCVRGRPGSSSHN